MSAYGATDTADRKSVIAADVRAEPHVERNKETLRRLQYEVIMSGRDELIEEDRPARHAAW